MRALHRRLPRFADGRIDYTDSKVAPVVVVFVEHDDRILLLKRSETVGNYKGEWNAISGYLDRLEPVQRRALDEVKEETGIGKDAISSLRFGRPFKFFDKKTNVRLFIYTAVASLKKKPRVRMNWEHTQFRWVRKSDLAGFDTIHNLMMIFRRAHEGD